VREGGRDKGEEGDKVKKIPQIKGIGIRFHSNQGPQNLSGHQKAKKYNDAGGAGTIDRKYQQQKRWSVREKQTGTNAGRTGQGAQDLPIGWGQKPLENAGVQEKKEIAHDLRRWRHKFSEKGNVGKAEKSNRIS